MRTHRQETTTEQPGPKRVRFREVNRQGETKRAAGKGRAKCVCSRSDSEVDEVKLVILLAKRNRLTPTALDSHDENHGGHRRAGQIDSQLHHFNPDDRFHAAEVSKDDHHHAQQYH